MRPLSELLSPQDEGWRSFSDWSSASQRSVEVVAPDAARRGDCLLSMQVSTRSVMGALVWHTGGVFVDERWLRLLGGPSDQGPPDMAKASGSQDRPVDHVVVALDVVGGRFAVNGGGLPGDLGEVAYLGPDTLTWEPLSKGFSDFIYWTLTGDLATFYADLRWRGWEEQAQAVPGSSLLSCYPPLFSGEARDDPSAVSRRAVPWQEVVGWQDEVTRRLADVPDGSAFQIVVQDEEAPDGPASQ